MSISVASTSESVLDHPPMAIDVDSDDDVAPMDEEPEVDELDSDPEPVSPRKLKTTAPRVHGQRHPGTSLLPAQRLQTMIQADGIVGEDHAFSPEGLWMLSVATEEFIKKLAERSCQFADKGDGHAITATYKDISSVVKDEFDYLKEVIPVQSSLEWALKQRKAMDLDATARDPALSSSYYDTVQRPNVPYGTNPYLSFTQSLVHERKLKLRREERRQKQATNGSSSAPQPVRGPNYTGKTKAASHAPAKSQAEPEQWSSTHGPDGNAHMGSISEDDNM